jgi:hypothetical protein
MKEQVRWLMMVWAMRAVTKALFTAELSFVVRKKPPASPAVCIPASSNDIRDPLASMRKASIPELSEPSDPPESPASDVETPTKRKAGLTDGISEKRTLSTC